MDGGSHGRNFGRGKLAGSDCWRGGRVFGGLALVFAKIVRQKMGRWARYRDGHGIEMGTAGGMPVAAMLTQIVGLLLVSWFVGVTAVESKLLTFILAVFAYGLISASGTLFAKLPSSVAWINFGYLISASVVMFIAQGVF